MRIVLPFGVSGRKLCYGRNLPATGGEPKGECNVTLADDEAGFLCPAVLISQQGRASLRLPEMTVTGLGRVKTQASNFSVEYSSQVWMQVSRSIHTAAEPQPGKPVAGRKTSQYHPRTLCALCILSLEIAARWRLGEKDSTIF